MKQHITWEQFKELSEEARMNYLRWAREKGYCLIEGAELTFPDEYANMDVDIKMALPTIGQMIEFLYDPTIICNRGYDENNWRVIANLKEYGALEDNLCDALWEAVKQDLGID